MLCGTIKTLKLKICLFVNPQQPQVIISVIIQFCDTSGAEITHFNFNTVYVGLSFV